MCSIDINKPISKVLELFENRENRILWMVGFDSSSLISGIEGQVGAKSEIHFITGKRKLKMIETIKVSRLPDEFTCTYEAPGVLNTVKCMFAEISDTKTDFCTVQEFRFNGLYKIVALFMPGIFKKQSNKYLSAFKVFCESR